MARISIIGEVMLELTHPGGQGARLSFGGDTLNTAVYLARLGLAPHYISALGTDPYSDSMIRDFEQECVQTEFLLRHPIKLPGLYAVRTDHTGERSFHYWRSDSAARAFFELPEHKNALAFAAQADWLYLTGITLSIFKPAERRELVSIAREVRARGGSVVFDPNYRPTAWPDADAAWDAMSEFASLATLALPTIEDENALHGQAPGEIHAARWHALGVQDVVMKCGPQGAIVYQGGREPIRIAVDQVVTPVDTTGAGDSFNAGVIAALIKGACLADAVRSGNKLAGCVVQHPGAIAPRSQRPLKI